MRRQPICSTSVRPKQGSSPSRGPTRTASCPWWQPSPRRRAQPGGDGQRSGLPGPLLPGRPKRSGSRRAQEIRLGAAAAEAGGEGGAGVDLVDRGGGVVRRGGDEVGGAVEERRDLDRGQLRLALEEQGDHAWDLRGGARGAAEEI